MIMKIETKTLCAKCAGVVDGTVTDSETGEFPCYCDKIKQANKKAAPSDAYWRNGRDTFND